MMKKTIRWMSSSCLLFLPHSAAGITCRPPPPAVALFRFHSRFLLFSTKPNPIPNSNFPHSSNPTHARLRQLLLHNSKAGFDNLDDAFVVFNKMLHMKPLPNAIDFNQLLAALVKMKQYSVAVSLFRDMCVKGIYVNIVTFNTAINCFCHLNRLDYAFSLLAEIIKRGFVPTAVTYNTLIRGLISQDNPVEAQVLFTNLIRFKIFQPNVVTYTTVIDGLCKRGHISTALTLFRYMDKKGCQPDTVTYNTIVDCLCKLRLVDQALDLLHQMAMKGTSPNVITYTSLIQGLCDFSRWHDVKQLLREMDTSNISPDMYTFNILVDAYGKEGMIKDAEDVIEIMIQRGHYPDVVTYNSLMDGYCLRGEVDEALSVLETMKRRGIVPNIRTYNILINGYCKKWKVDRAIDLFQRLPHESLSPTIETYSTILQGFFHTGRHVEARKFFKEKMMLNKGLTLDKVTCSILLHGLCQNRFVVEALSFFDTMLSAGLTADICIYSTLIDGLSKNGHLEKARSLFDNLPLKGLRPDVKTYTMMIQAYCHEGLFDEANELFVNMEANNCLPNDVTYNTLIRGCFHHKKYNEASALIDEMRAHSFAADASTTSLLLDLLESEEQDPALLALRKRCGNLNVEATRADTLDNEKLLVAKIYISDAGLRVEAMPKNLAVIADGQMRWARKKGLPLKFGHATLLPRYKELARLCCKCGIKVLTAFVFSRGNWNPPKEHVESMMSLLEEGLISNLEKSMKHAIQISITDDRRGLPNSLIEVITEVKEKTKAY